MPPLLGVYVFIAGRLVRRRLVFPPTRLVGHTTVVGRLRLHRPACLRLRRLVSSPTRLAYYAAVVGHSTTSPSACLCRRRHVYSPIRLVGHTTAHGRPRLHRPAGLRRRRLMFPPARLAYYAAVVGRLRLHRRPPRPPPTGVSAYTVGWSHHRCWASTSSPTGLPSPAPTSVFAYMAGLLCCHCWASITSPSACLHRRRLVYSPIRLVGHTTAHGRPRLHRPACFCHRRLVSLPTRLAYYAAIVGRLRLHRWSASVAADWCLRLHGWPIMPPLLGVYDFTDRLAFAAADWCPRLHGWPIMLPLLGVYDLTTGLPPSPPIGVFACMGSALADSRCMGAMTSRAECINEWISQNIITGLPSSPPTGVLAYTVGWSHHHCWASLSSPTGFLVRRRLVSPPARLAYYAAVVGRLRLHRPAASSASDWCFRLYGWLVYYAAVVGRLRLHRPAALSVADCWPIMPPLLLDVYIFTDRLPRMTPTDAIGFTAGHVAATANKLSTSAADWFLHLVYTATTTDGRHRLHCWPPYLTPTGLSPPRLRVFVTIDGHHHYHQLAFAADDWCLRLDGWPIMISLMDAFVFTVWFLPSPTGVSIFTTMRLRHRFASVASDSYSLHHGYATLSPWWSNFIFIVFCTSKPNCCYFASFSTSPTTMYTRASTSRHAPLDLMPCYFTTTNGVPIFNISTQTYSMHIFTQVMATR
uniref:cysteine dioxygenase n=1 Tax=Oryza sativa subsp. japonica TaxID=39947 RepID=Q5WMT6_ORYSJ|nr:hypothetical protein [Oryza sativa Japonica Group]